MPKCLIVAEKPSVARDIARVLGVSGRKQGYMEGKDYVISWAIGHLVTQCTPEEINPHWKRWNMYDLPMLPDNLPLKVLPQTQGQFDILKSLMHDDEVDRVICATDAGREGELIFRRIAQMAQLAKPVQRLWISSMTDEAIRQGFDSLRPSQEYDSLYESARCRADADWLVGMNGSRAFTLRCDTLLSVGRVQTPTLAILVRRRKEIEAFVPEKYAEVQADFGDYKGMWIDGEGKTRIADPEKAKAIAAQVRKKNATVAKSDREIKRIPPPYLYDLTNLQRDANKRYGLTADQTLKAAQSLYEQHKAITYPRTDSAFLPQDMIGPVKQTLRVLPPAYREIAELVPQEIPVTPRVFNDKKITDHHAIIPTKKPPGNMALPEKQVYDLIVRRFVAAFLEDYCYEALRVETLCEGHTFLSLGQVPVQSGWREAIPLDEKSKSQDNQLPDLAVGDERMVQGAKTLSKSTKPPSPHTEASLLSAMERAGKEIEDEAMRELMKDNGLGTPATRAAIIERLIAVGYAQRSGKALHATDKGVFLIDVVPEELSSPETTGKWERGLMSIRNGTMEPERFMGSIRRYTTFLTESAKKVRRMPKPPQDEKKK